jgi:hypothetical protein
MNHATFKIKEHVRPYGGRRLRHAAPYGVGMVAGFIDKATGRRAYRLTELAPDNVEAVNVIEETRRQFGPDK